MHPTPGRYRPRSPVYILRLLKEALVAVRQRLTRSSVSLRLSDFDQPFGILQIAAINWLLLIVARVIAHRGVVLVDLQTRNAVIVEFYRPRLLCLHHTSE